MPRFPAVRARAFGFLAMGLVLCAASDPPGPAQAASTAEGCRGALSRYLSTSIEAMRRPSSRTAADRRDEAGIAFLERGCPAGTFLVARFALSEAARTGSLAAVLE